MPGDMESDAIVGKTMKNIPGSVPDFQTNL